MEPETPPRERLCRAFRQAYEAADLTQEQLSELTGIRQATISKYARGETTPPLDVLELVDAAVGRPKGHCLRLAGYVEGDADTVAAIHRDRQDGTVDEDGEAALLHLYRVFVKRSDR